MSETIRPHIESIKPNQEALRPRIDLDTLDQFLPRYSDTEMSLLADMLSPRVK